MYPQSVHVPTPLKMLTGTSNRVGTRNWTWIWVGTRNGTKWVHEKASIGKLPFYVPTRSAATMNFWRSLHVPTYSISCTHLFYFVYPLILFRVPTYSISCTHLFYFVYPPFYFVYPLHKSSIFRNAKKSRKYRNEKKWFSSSNFS